MTSEGSKSTGSVLDFFVFGGLLEATNGGIMGILSEFKQFIARGNVMDMAVGIVVGAAFTAIVTSLVGDVINPIIGMIIGGIDFSNYYLDLSQGGYATLKEAETAGAPIIKYGLFINAVIKFLIVAFVVFMMVKQINRLKSQFEEKKDAAPYAPPADVVLLTEIRDLLKQK
jgi:large conductance mechanosensitive channel